ncbi:carbohydrate binding [Branchiostoma belcheri]|nr:carbohydrate binding [Branchiostoma belcheri]
MTFQAMYRGMLLLLAVGGTAILQSSAAPEKRDLSVAEKVESFMERLEALIGAVEVPCHLVQQGLPNGDLTEEFGGESWLPQTRQVGCSGGYRMRNGICYKAFNTPKNFHDASLTCVADGGTLAMPKDAGTNGFLLSLKNAVHRAGFFWFGLVDHHQEGRWEWIDGTPLGFRAWGPGEPNNSGDEDCAEYFPTAWNDAPCSRTDRKFICQKIPAGCPGGYIYHQPSRQCYKAFNEKRTYSGAVARCSADRGTLAMPRDTATNKFLIYLKNAVDINGLFRFGLTDNHREGGWKWANNIPLGPFKAWGPGEPNNYANEDCAEYNAGIVAAPYSSIKNMWNDFECSNANRKFICQVSPVHSAVTVVEVILCVGIRTSPHLTIALPFPLGARGLLKSTRPPVVQATCPAGYRPFQQNCFKAFPQTKPDYSWAMKACQAEGGRLAMPKDAATNAFLVQLKNAVQNNAAFYIGLSDQNAEGQWRFADGTALGFYNNWNPGEPNNVRNEDCATLLPGYGGKWNDLSCSSNLRYICQVSPIRPGGTSGLRRVCEHQTLTISCPAGRQINIVSALYGRTSRGFCPSSQIRTTSCRSPNSLVWVRGSCQGRSSCSVRASNSVFGDPCYGTFKYLEVSYTCIACSGKREMPDPGEPDPWPEEPGIGEADPQEPEIGEPGSQEPEIGEPGSQESEIGEPGSQEPEIGESGPQEPEIGEPGSQEPEIGEPGSQESEIGEPGSQEPEIGKLGSQEPEIGEPGSQEPEIGESGPQEPEIGEPGSQEPEIGEPGSQEPEIGEPGSQEPEIGEPGSQEHEIGEPGSQEPEIGEPDSQEPEIGKPGSQEPEIGEPGSQEPEIGEPDSQEPEIGEPGSQEPEIGEPGSQEPEIGEAFREEDMLEKALAMLENEVRNEEDNLEYGLEE